jgi:hypothetical protein
MDPGSTMSQLMDAAGNNRGANVDASNNLMVNIGAGSIANTSFAATQATAASLNATVVGTGTFATQVTSLPALPAGSNNIGQVEQTDGTNVANILSSAGTSAGQNAQIIANQYPALSTATWTSSTTLNTALAQSCVGQGTATVTTVETGTTTTAGALTFEVYDGTNWWAVTGQQVGSYTVQSSYTLANGTNVAWQFDVGGFQQFRVRLSTAITGTGSPQVVVILQMEASQNDVAPTVGWGQKLDSVNDSITNYPFGHSYTYISTATTTTVKSGSGFFKSMIVNGGTTGTIIIYDNTAGSGTVIASFDTTNYQNQYLFEAAFSTGLTVVTSAATKLTIIYR